MRIHAFIDVNQASLYTLIYRYGVVSIPHQPTCDSANSYKARASKDNAKFNRQGHSFNIMSQETKQACVKDAIEHLITTYGELNSSSIEELDCEPSPLDFMRYVARNTPFVVRGGASSWRAFDKWDKDYLVSALAGQSVNVAVTPHG